MRSLTGARDSKSSWKKRESRHGRYSAQMLRAGSIPKIPIEVPRELEKEISRRGGTAGRPGVPPHPLKGRVPVLGALQRGVPSCSYRTRRPSRTRLSRACSTSFRRAPLKPRARGSSSQEPRLRSTRSRTAAICSGSFLGQDSVAGAASSSAAGVASTPGRVVCAASRPPPGF